MNQQQLHKFIEYLTQQNIVFGPQKIDDQLVIRPVTDPKTVVLANELPLHSFKSILVPATEILFDYQGQKIQSAVNSSNQVIFGLTVPDLKAITMLSGIFADDPYYQQRLKKTLIVGYSAVPQESHQFFIEDFKEQILEHLQFDVFLAGSNKNFVVYSGSEDGQRLLDDFGLKNYKHIQYVGPIREEGPDKQMLKIKENFYNRQNDELWQELGQRCIECGKCTLICPTCFCFDIFDSPGLESGSGQRCRRWATCFYTDFSEVAGPEIEQKKPKFLSTTAQRIKFWYEHKFVRIPHEISLPGCVGCGRCTKVCPVGIDIKKNLQIILQSKIK